MINPEAPTTEVLPGFTRADLIYLAECLEGRHGEGRRAEAGPRSAEFIRAATVRAALAEMKRPGYGLPRLMVGQRAPTDNDLEAVDVASNAFQLTESERRMIEKQRAHEARNRSNEEDGNGGIPT